MGIRRLIRVVRTVVSRRVADLQLSKSLSADELRALLEDVRGELMPAVMGGWVVPLSVHAIVYS